MSLYTQSLQRVLLFVLALSKQGYPCSNHNETCLAPPCTQLPDRYNVLVGRAAPAFNMVRWGDAEHMGYIIRQPVGGVVEWNTKYINDIAEAAYDKIKSKYTDGRNVVAALWIPKIGCWIATKPRSAATGDYDKAGKVLTEMFGTGATVAPVWFRYVSERDEQARPLSRRYHAEDGAYFLMERTLDPKPTATGNYENIKPQGGRPYISVYGKGKSGSRVGPIPPCSRGDRDENPDPPCSFIAAWLHVDTN